MRRLLLLRHAKAVQDSGEGDFARALTERGRADATHMGHTLDTKAYWPDLVLCSSSARTVETFERLAPELAKSPKAEFHKSLYLAPPRQMSDVLRTSPDNALTILMIGHNPGTEELAAKLARKPQSKSEARHLENLLQKYPTCALSVLDFEIEAWSAVAPGAGTLMDFIRPKDIKD